MTSFFSLINKLLRESAKQQIVNERIKLKAEKAKPKEESIPIKSKQDVRYGYEYPQKNKYTVSTSSNEAKAKFFEILNNNSYKINDFLPFAIKAQLRIHELEKYIEINRKRYVEKISAVFNKKINFHEINLQQKLEILKGFRPTQFKTDYCVLNFFNADERENMIFFLEFDILLLNKYHWIIDDLGGIKNYSENWYLLKTHTTKNEISFLPLSLFSNDLFKVLEVREILTFIKEPPIEMVLEKIPFSRVKEKFMLIDEKVKSRHEAILLSKAKGLGTFEIFSFSELDEMKGKFYKVSNSFYKLVQEFDALMKFWKLVGNVI